MKTKTLIFTCLICFTALLTSCDNTRPEGGNYDDGESGGDEGKGPHRSISNIAIQITNQDNNTLQFYFREPIGIVNITISNASGKQFVQQLLNTNETALAAFDLSQAETGNVNIEITDAYKNIIYKEVYELE